MASSHPKDANTMTPVLKLGVREVYPSLAMLERFWRRSQRNAGTKVSNRRVKRLTERELDTCSPASFDLAHLEALWALRTPFIRRSGAGMLMAGVSSASA